MSWSICLFHQHYTSKKNGYVLNDVFIFISSEICSSSLFDEKRGIVFLQILTNWLSDMLT